MKKCWHKEPMKRPTFMTIHNDFVDFDATSQEYNYAYTDYMKREGITSEPTMPSSTNKRNKHQKPKGTPRPSPKR